MSKKISYAWVVFIGAFIMTFMVVGLANSPNSLYQIPITQEYGFSRTSYSVVLSLFMVFAMFAHLAFGVLQKKLGVRKVIFMGGIIITAALMVFSISTTLPAFYFAGSLLGFGFGFSSISSAAALVNNWFTKKKGTVMGLIFAGSGFGGTVFSMLVGEMIQKHGFKYSFRVSAILILAAVIVITLLVRNSPKDLKGKNAGEAGDEVIHEEGTLTYKEGFKRGNFILGAFAVLIMGIIIHPVLVIAPVFLQDKGIDPVVAATISGVVYFSAAFGKMGLGIFYDKFGPVKTMGVVFATFIGGSLILLITASQWVAVIFAIVFGISVASQTVIVPCFVSSFIKSEDYNKFIGIFVAILTGGTALGIPVISSAYDVLGSYRPMIIIFIVLAVIAFILSVLTEKITKSRYSE